MNEIGDLIKELAINAIDNEKPVELVVGVVLSKAPLSIRLEQKMTIDRKFVDVCRGAEYDEGEQVALIRYKGGQKYLLIDCID